MRIRSSLASWLPVIVSLFMVFAVLPPVASAAGAFTDDDGSVHELNIEAIAAAGITFGCDPDGGLFCPAEPVTRGQMASFIARAFGLPDAGHDLFDDDNGSTHEANINKVAAALIALGYEDGTYRPNNLVTRGQMASFIARAMSLAPLTTGSFVDVSGVHEGNINAIADAGVTVGCTAGGNFYCPDDNVRRDQMASFLARALGLAVPTDLMIEAYLQNLPDWEVFLEDYPEARAEEFDGRTPDMGADLVTEWYEDTLYECVVTPYTLTSNPREIVMFEPDSNILWTGALLQGDGYVDGIGSLQELPIRQRAPLTVSLDLLTSDNTRTVDNPTVASVGQALGDMIAVAESRGLQPAGSVFFEKEETHSVEQSALHMGLSARYLGGSVAASLDIDRAADEHSVTAYFVEKAFTLSMVLPQLPGDVFSSEFTPEVLEAQQALGRIGEENLPVFVANVTYGRILMFTMTSSYSMSEMEAALSAMYGSGAFEVAGEIDASHLEVIANSRVQVATIGGNSSNALALIHSGELGAYFAETADLSSYRPISYTIRNLGDNSIAKVSETTEYNITECTAIEAGQVDIGDKVLVTLESVRNNSADCGGRCGDSEIYGWFKIDDHVVWDLPQSGYLPVATGGSVLFDSYNNHVTVDFVHDAGTEVVITGELKDEDSGVWEGGTDDVIGTFSFSISEPLTYGRHQASSGGATLFYSIEDVGNVYGENTPPLVDAGATRSEVIAAADGAVVTVDLNPPLATDDGRPVGAMLTYAWSIDSPDPTDATIDHPDPASPAATLTVRTADVYTLRLDVSDTLSTGTDTVLVEVTENTPPEAQAIGATTGVDTTVPIALIGTDDDGHALTWEIVDQPTNGTVDPLTGTDADWVVTFTPAAGNTGDATFTYRVFDGYDYSETVTVTVTIS